MKIALLYSGAIRNLAQSIHNNLDYFAKLADEIDLYFSIWDHVGYVDHLNAPDYIKAERVFLDNEKITNEKVESLIPVTAARIRIKEIKIESYNAENYSMLGSPNLGAQYYKILDCFNLLDEKENYDMIARMRCDVLLNNQISKEEVIKSLEDNKIIFSTDIWYEHPRQPAGLSINEMIWLARKDLMKKACNILNNEIEIAKIAETRNESKYGESVCFMNLEVEDMVSNIHLFDFDYNVLR